jgi:hypothetical protein
MNSWYEDAGRPRLGAASVVFKPTVAAHQWLGRLLAPEAGNRVTSVFPDSTEGIVCFYLMHAAVTVLALITLIGDLS